MQGTYMKDCKNDHWDDYQLRSVQLGGNQPFFEIMREYGTENEQNHRTKYTHPAVLWYKKKHLADMEGSVFD